MEVNVAPVGLMVLLILASGCLEGEPSGDDNEAQPSRDAVPRQTTTTSPAEDSTNPSEAPSSSAWGGDNDPGPEPAMLASIADVYVDAKKPGANFAQISSLSAQDLPDGSEEMVSLVKFHVAAIDPANTNSACLRLTVQGHNAGNAVPVTVSRFADSSWGEQALTWDTMEFSRVPEAYGTHEVTGFYHVVWNVTQALANADHGLLSFFIESDAQSYHGVVFEAGDQPNGPKLLLNDSACNSPGQQLEPGELVVSIYLSNTNPCPGDEVTAYVHVEGTSGPVKQANITTTWNHAGAPITMRADADDAGNANVTRTMPATGQAGEVRVDAEATLAGATGMASASLMLGSC